MIKRIELWNWESHEHTVVRDLDPAFNLIWGDSDAGKSSIVRALKLVAHNQFDPESVRVGASDAEVEVETERGVVHVTRGKKNIWKVTTKGKPAQIFDKIGKKPLPEAVEVLGLGMVELGDMSMSVNLMDQAEAHFMLAEFDGSNATGSARAQVIDEISGLSGIEGLIKEVSLDCHRFGRSIKDDEDKLEAIEAQMHDADALKREKTTLVDVRSALQDHVDFDAAANLATQTHDEHEQGGQRCPVAEHGPLRDGAHVDESHPADGRSRRRGTPAQGLLGSLNPAASGSTRHIKEDSRWRTGKRSS